VESSLQSYLPFLGFTYIFFSRRFTPVNGVSMSPRLTAGLFFA